MKLYLIRHGESTANEEHKHAGWQQVSLSEKGRADALRAGTLLRGISFDRVYVSDLVRAKETMELALPGANGIETPLLREIHVGDLSGKTAAECTELYGDRYLDGKALHDFTSFGGENAQMHLDRIRAFVRMLEEDPQPAVAAFCHEGSIRWMLAISQGSCRSDRSIRLDNGSVSVFEYTDGKWVNRIWNQTADA